MRSGVMYKSYHVREKNATRSEKIMRWLQFCPNFAHPCQCHHRLQEGF